MLVKNEEYLTMLHLIQIPDNITTTNTTSGNKAIEMKMKDILVIKK